MLMVTDPNSIVVNCPVCKRVIWAHATCTHGEVPVPLVPADPDQEPDEPQPKKRRKW